MVSHQREMGAFGGVIMEGRDIGTKVFPDADVKIFLDAKLDVRAERRVKQVSADGDQANAKQIAEQMQQRDRRDSTRTESPLIPATDAVKVDSSNMTIEEVIQYIEHIVQQKLQTKSAGATQLG
jgi:cytidylate kinase